MIGPRRRELPGSSYILATGRELWPFAGHPAFPPGQVQGQLIPEGCAGLEVPAAKRLSTSLALRAFAGTFARQRTNARLLSPTIGSLSGVRGTIQAWSGPWSARRASWRSSYAPGSQETRGTTTVGPASRAVGAGRFSKARERACGGGSRR